VLAEFLARRQRLIEALVAQGLNRPASSEQEVQTVVALTDFAVHRSLLHAGLPTEQAAAQITDVLVPWLRRTARSRKEAAHAD